MRQAALKNGSTEPIRDDGIPQVRPAHEAQRSMEAAVANDGFTEITDPVKLTAPGPIAVVSKRVPSGACRSPMRPPEQPLRWQNYIIAMGLAAVRKRVRADRGVRDGRWERLTLQPGEPGGKTWGLIGSG